MRNNLKRVSCALKKKTVLVVILFLMLITGLTFFIQPAKAASVTILSHNGHLDSAGNYYVFGEFQNLDTATVKCEKVTATFYDSANTLIVVKDWNTGFLDIILPNQKSPFYVLLNNKTQASIVDHYTLEVTTSYEPIIPIDVRILSNSSSIDIMGWMHITGEVENAGTTNASYTKVFVTCYDSGGKVVYTSYMYADASEISPGQKSPFEILIGSTWVPLVKSYVLTALSYFTSTSVPTTSQTPTLTPSVSPISTSTSTPTVTPTTSTVAQLSTVAWAPPPENAAAATVVTAVAVGVVSIVVAAATSPVGTSAGNAVEKTRELLPESVKKWLSDFASSKRKPSLDQKTGSPFLPTKAEALAYGLSLAVLTISFSYVKVNDFTLILAVLPTILATAVIVEFVKTFSLVVFARKLGVWTEHRLWYFGLAMFLVTTFAFGIPFSSPSRSLYNAQKFTKTREGIVSVVAILTTLAFAAFFFVLLISGITLIGSTGLAMCVIMAFLDTFPVAPMNGKAIYQHSKVVWAVLFAVTLVVYASWLILL